ncbi:MAG TPA: hypothetical protein VN213_20995 [Solirubrobacteraceae bacterium]|nr:hypothetical protein [Solirubrobacteraceae bacterium]
MTPTVRVLQEGAAIAVLAALVAAVVVSAVAAIALVGGGAGFAAGVLVGAGTAQLLRRPAGQAMARFIDA